MGFVFKCWKFKKIKLLKFSEKDGSVLYLEYGYLSVNKYCSAIKPFENQ